MTSVENDQKREAINSPEKAKAAKVARKEEAVKTSEENIPECPKDVGPGKVRCWDLQGSGDCGFRAGAGSLRAHFLDRFGRKFWIASGGRSGRKLLSSAGVVLCSTE